MCSHIGCLTTALVAFMNGIQVFVVADAQADFSLADHTMALDYVSGRCDVVVAATGYRPFALGMTAHQHGMAATLLSDIALRVGEVVDILLTVSETADAADTVAATAEAVRA